MLSLAASHALGRGIQLLVISVGTYLAYTYKYTDIEDLYL